MVFLVCALAENRVIGRDGELPWRLPSDLRRFKALTTGKTIVMGRKTWESIGRPLPHRRNVVLTRNRCFRAAGAEVVHTLADALAMGDEVAVIGGEAVYAAALPSADRLCLSVVHTELAGDAHFPPFDPGEWHLVERVDVSADERHDFGYTYVELRRGPGEPTPFAEVFR